MDLNLCIYNGTVSTKIYDKRDDFDFDIVNLPFLSTVYLRFARTSTNLSDFNFKPLLTNFLSRAIVILNFGRRFRNFIAGTVPW